MPRIRLNQEAIDLVERIIVHLIQLHVSNEVDDFLEYLAESFGEVTTPTPSTVEIDEIIEDEDTPLSPPPPQQHGPAPSKSQPQQREAAQSATRMDDEHIQFTTQDGHPYVDPNPRRDENQAPRPVTVEEAWTELELRLNTALDLSIEAACEEKDVFEAFDLFVARYGRDAFPLLGKWPQMIERRQQELSVLDSFRDQRCREEARQRREEEIKERNRERAKIEKEAADRKRAEALNKAQREREEAELRARRIQEERQLADQRLREEQERAEHSVREAKRKVELAKDEIRRQQNRQTYRETNPRKIECFVCGLPGVKRSKDCPNFYNHKNVRSCGGKSHK